MLLGSTCVAGNVCTLTHSTSRQEHTETEQTLDAAESMGVTRTQTLVPSQNQIQQWFCSTCRRDSSRTDKGGKIINNKCPDVKVDEQTKAGTANYNNMWKEAASAGTTCLLGRNTPRTIEGGYFAFDADQQRQVIDNQRSACIKMLKIISNDRRKQLTLNAVQIQTSGSVQSI